MGSVQFQENGVAMCMYNIESSIFGFARSCMNRALTKVATLPIDQKHHHESL